MISKEKLQGKQIVFRFLKMPQIYAGTVKHVEADGFWIDSPGMIDEMLKDESWKKAVANVKAPVLFVPISSLYYLIVSGE